MAGVKEFFFHPLVIDLFWRQGRSETERLIRQNLARFLPVRGNKVALGPEHILALEKGLTALKNLPAGPPVLLLPFSLAPEGAFKKALLRPGKVYLSASEKKIFEERLGELPFLAKLEPWQGLYELQIPATTDPELLFRYRDLLLVGPFKPCLRCGLPWHRTSSCPAKKAKVPGKGLYEFLHEPLENLARRLNRGFEDWSKQGAEWNRRLSERYYYLQPGFLRQFFQSNAKKWENFNPFREKPGGGPLFLALEALQFGQYKEAQKRLEDLFAERHDWRALVALAHLALDKEDLVEALYYAESALGQNDTPLVQAYLCFLKGWLFEQKGDLLKAEESYREALRIDRSCFPAQFHLRLFMARYHLWEDVLQQLPLLCQDPLGFFLVFIEPRFWPVATQVEETLLDLFKERQAQAASRLAAAENNLRPVIKLLPEKQAEELQSSLESIRQKVYQGGYLDFLEAERQGLSLSLEAQGLLYRQVQETRRRFSRLKERFQAFEVFWRTKGERDVEFRALLDGFQEKLGEIEAALSQNPTGNLRTCAKKLENLEKKIEEIQRAQEELRARLRFKHQLYTFIKTFVVLEVFLFLVFLFYPRVSQFLFPQSEPYFFSPTSFFLFSLGLLVVAILRALGQKN